MSGSKHVPQLRSIPSPERSTSLKARESWHILGIISEFVEATERLADIRPAVSVFGSARVRPGHRWYETTVTLSRLLSEAGFSVISGGGPGIMEAANRGAQEAGAESVALNIALPNEQKPNPYVSKHLSFKFHYFAMRKMHFMLRAKALIAFPGGFGTLDELFEMLTLIQTQKAQRVPVLLYGRDYWQRAINFDTMCEVGTITPQDRELFQYVDSPAQAWEAIQAFYKKTS